LPTKSTLCVVAVIFAVDIVTCACVAGSLTRSMIIPTAGSVEGLPPFTIVVKVSQGIDDGYRWVRNGSHYVDRSGVCYDTGKYYIIDEQMIADSWWLFRGVNIPQGATVLNAKLTFTASANQNGYVCNTALLAEAVDNAAPIVGDFNIGWNDYENRPKTVAVIYWHDLPAWSQGAEYISPDISPVIQEIVNRPGWAPGNALQIFWMDDGSSEGVEKAVRSACGYEYPLAPGSGQYAVQLEVTYVTD